MLEILIPTYKREQSAVQAVESCVGNPLISVRCNSNCKSEYLEEYFKKINDDKFIFTSFEENQGISKNIFHLILSSEQKYLMLMSDEDEVDISKSVDFVDFINDLSNDVGVVFCCSRNRDKSIAYNSLFGKNLKLSRDELFLSGFPVSTYISGLVFSKKYLEGLDLNKYTKKTQGNAYSHLDLVIDVLDNSCFTVFQDEFLIKGEDVLAGGEAFEHVPDGKSSLLLNPYVYGAKARIRQFCYVISFPIKGKVGFWADFIYKYSRFLFFSRAYIDSKKITVDFSKNIQLEGFKGIKEAVTAGEFRFDIWMLLMMFVIISPPFFDRALIYLLGFPLRMHQKKYK